MDTKILNRMRKLLALAERGVGGEKVNAERMLRNTLAKYDMTLDDLADDEIQSFKLTWSKADHKEILWQIIFRVLNKGGESIKYRARAGYRYIHLEMTKAENVEIMELYGRMKTAWDKDRKEIMLAFVWKHELYDADAPEGESTLTDEEIDEIYRKMKGLSDAPLGREYQIT